MCVITSAFGQSRVRLSSEPLASEILDYQLRFINPNPVYSHRFTIRPQNLLIAGHRERHTILMWGWKKGGRGGRVEYATDEEKGSRDNGRGRDLVWPLAVDGSGPVGTSSTGDNMSLMEARRKHLGDRDIADAAH